MTLAPFLMASYVHFLHPYIYCAIDAHVSHPLLDQNNLAHHRSISIMTYKAIVYCMEIL